MFSPESRTLEKYFATMGKNAKMSQRKELARDTSRRM